MYGRFGIEMLKIDPQETFFFMYLEQNNWRNYNSQTIKSYSYVFSPSVISNILNIQLILGFLFENNTSTNNFF